LLYPLPIRHQSISFNYDPCISNPLNVYYDVATYYFDISVPGNAQGYIIRAQVNFRVNGLANLFAGSGNIGATYTAEIPGTVGLPVSRAKTIVPILRVTTLL
jgi:hypothetical protein